MSNMAEVIRLAQMGKRAEKRGKALKGCLSALLLKASSDLMAGWFLMLAVGIAHAEWLPMLPTIGFWWAVLLVVLLRPLSARSPRSKTRD